MKQASGRAARTHHLARSLLVLVGVLLLGLGLTGLPGARAETSSDTTTADSDSSDTTASGTAASGTAASGTATSSDTGSSDTGGANDTTATSGTTTSTSTTGSTQREFASTLTLTIGAITPAVVTANGGNTLTITGTVGNFSDQSVGELEYTAVRGDPLRTSAAVRAELTSPSQPVRAGTQLWLPLAADLAPGASEPFTVTVPLTGSDSLALAQAGVYPLMINVNGRLTQDGEPLHARVGELHTVLTVLSVPTAAGAAPHQPATTKPVPLSMLWPVVDRPHLGVAGIFLDDDLVDSISPGGRLWSVLDALPEADPTGTLVTLEIDPELLDELDQMSDGYLVSTGPQPALQLATPAPAGGTSASAEPTPSPRVPPVPPPRRSTADASAVLTTTARKVTDESLTVPATHAGRGAAAAGTFLRRLRTAAEHHPVLVLPYGDPDVVALARTGAAAELRALVVRGQQLAQRLLAPPPGAPPVTLITRTVAPADGLLDPTALDAIASTGADSLVLAGATVREPEPGGGRVRTSTGGRLIAAVADSDLLEPIHAVTDATRTDLAARTGLLAQISAQALAGSAAPVVWSPDRRWTPTAGLIRFAGLARLLLGTGVLVGRPVDAIAREVPQTTVALAYPAAADRQLLSFDYLRGVQSDRQWLARLEAALVATPVEADLIADPTLVLTALNEAMDRMYSTAWRADRQPADLIGSTLSATISGLRGGVTILSSGDYTLLSATAPLLIVVQNTLPYDVRIQPMLHGDTGLGVTQPGAATVPANGSHQFRIETRVDRSGTFSVAVDLIGADGVPWNVGASQLTVNSSVYGTVTVIVVIAAGAALLILSFFRIRQRWRDRVRRLAGEPAAAPDTDAGSDSILDADNAADPGADSTADSTADPGDGFSRAPADQTPAPARAAP